MYYSNALYIFVIIQMAINDSEGGAVMSKKRKAVVGSDGRVYGGNIISRKMAQAKWEAKTAEQDARVANSAMLQSIFSRISDVYTASAYIGTKVIRLTSYTGEFNEFTAGKEVTFSFNFEENGYNPLRAEDALAIAEYIGRHCFHNKFRIERDSFTSGGYVSKGPDTIIGVTPNTSGGGYTVRTSSSGGGSDRVVVTGYSVYNSYASELVSRHIEAIREEKRRNNKNLL